MKALTEGRIKDQQKGNMRGRTSQKPIAPPPAPFPEFSKDFEKWWKTHPFYKDWKSGKMLGVMHLAFKELAYQGWNACLRGQHEKR